MRTINLKDNIFINSFNSAENAEIEWGSHMWWDNYRGVAGYELLYIGKVSEVPDALAATCIIEMYPEEVWAYYQDYSGFEHYCFMPNESIKTACYGLPYCIIYKVL